MPPVGFEPTFSAGERPQTYALDCAATGTITKNGYISKSEWYLRVKAIYNFRNTEDL